MADPQMRSYWRSHLWSTMPAGEKLNTAYTLFSQLGAGEVFSRVFGILGLAAFGWHFITLAQKRLGARTSEEMDVATFMRLYSVGMIAVAWLLFALGKLPLGEARLNTFLTPAIAWMMVDFLGWMSCRKKPFAVAASALTILLYVGTAGNIFTTIAAQYTDALWPVKRRIYFTIEDAIQTAQMHHLPILATPRIAFPEEAHDNVPFPEKMPGDWVLKTHPAYHFRDSILVRRLSKPEAAVDVLNTLPTPHAAAVVCAGDTFFVVRGYQRQ